MPHQLLRLLAANRNSPRRFEVAASADGEATIFLYDIIVATQEEADWYGGVAADAFVKAVIGIDASTIHLRINSPGGDVFGARAMEQALREHPANVVVHVDGVAASAASFLMVSGDERYIAPGAFVMIHKAWTMAVGNSADLLATASLLDKVDESLVTSYAAATGQDPQQLRDWMAAETWFSAEEAVRFGFAGSISSEEAKAAGRWNLSAFSKAPSTEPDGSIDLDRLSAAVAERLKLQVPPTPTNTVDPRDRLSREVDALIRAL